MKNILFLLAFTVLSISFTIVYQNTIDYRVGEDFSITIKGTSNIHDWESAVTEVSGAAAVSFGEDGRMQIETCKISIPVKSIVSGKGSIMDKKTWRALEDSDHPTINYQLTSFDNLIESDGNFTASTTGKLEIAGTTKSTQMQIKGKELGDGTIEITGSKKLKMTDFNIAPPTALLGTLTTGDDITIDFRIILKR